MTPKQIAKAAKEAADNWAGPDVDLSTVSTAIMFDGYEQGVKAGIQIGLDLRTGGATATLIRDIIDRNVTYGCRCNEAYTRQQLADPDCCHCNADLDTAVAEISLLIPPADSES